MKNLIFIMVLCAFIFPIHAQKIIEKHIDFSQKESIDLDIQIADSIVIHTWKKKGIYIKASVNVKDNKDNEEYITSFDETGKIVKIKANFKEDYLKGQKNCCNESTILWEFYIPENTVLSVETINGNITIAGITTEIKAKSISGFIDLTVPSYKKSDLTFNTITGTIYSNHEFAANNNKFSFSDNPKIYEKVNGDGTPIKLETISGDIYFRELK